MSFPGSGEFGVAGRSARAQVGRTLFWLAAATVFGATCSRSLETPSAVDAGDRGGEGGRATSGAGVGGERAVSGGSGGGLADGGACSAETSFECTPGKMSGGLVICENQFTPSICVNGAWTCPPEGLFPANQCDCPGSSFSPCNPLCASLGLNCRDAGTDGPGGGAADGADATAGAGEDGDSTPGADGSAAIPCGTSSCVRGQSFCYTDQWEDPVPHCVDISVLSCEDCSCACSICTASPLCDCSGTPAETVFCPREGS